MTQILGNFRPNSTVRFMWNTNGANGASITRGTNGTIRIIKNSSTLARNSSNGITDIEDFGGAVGIHQCLIDLSDNTDSGFYSAGNDYFVIISGAAIDSQTVNACLAKFCIDNQSYLLADSGNFIPPTAAQNADAVWDEAIIDHIGSHTFGGQLGSLSGLIDNIPTNLEFEARTLPSGQYSSFNSTIDKVFLGDGVHGGTGSKLILGDGLLSNIAGNISGNLLGSVNQTLTLGSESINSSTFSDGAINHNVLAENAIATDRINIDVFQAIRDYIWNAALVNYNTSDTMGGQLGSLSGLIDNIPTNSEFQDRTLPSGQYAIEVWTYVNRTLTAGTNIILNKGIELLGFNDPAASDNADAVWDEILSGHLNVGTAGAYLNNTSGVLTAISGVTLKLDTTLELDSTVYRFTTNALEQGPVGGGSSPATIAAAVWDELLGAHLINGSAGAYIVGLSGSIEDIPTNLEFQARTLPSGEYNNLTSADIWTYSNRSLTQAVDISGTIKTLDTLNTNLSSIHGAGSWTTATGFSTHSAADTADAVWDELLGGHTSNGSASQYLITNSGNISNIQTRLPATLVSGRIDSSVGAYQTGLTPLQPTVTGRTLDVTSTGAAGIDWGNIENSGQTVNFSGTTIGIITTLATDSISAAAISTAAANKLADISRRRTQANVEASSFGDSLDLSSAYGFIQQAQESSIVGTTITVKKTDGTTTLGTKTVTVDATANPITGVS